jgi:hypothetical protein
VTINLPGETETPEEGLLSQTPQPISGQNPSIFRRPVARADSAQSSYVPTNRLPGGPLPKRKNLKLETAVGGGPDRHVPG